MIAIRTRTAGAVAAAALLLAGLTATATASAHSESGERTIHLVATTEKFKATTDKANGPAAADIYAYQDKLTDRAGHRLGEDHCFCVAVDKDNLVCDGVLMLKRGSLTFTQPFNNATSRGTGAITGGTGDYTGVTGIFTAVGRKHTDPQVYDYTLNLSGAAGEEDGE